MSNTNDPKMQTPSQSSASGDPGNPLQNGGAPGVAEPEVIYYQGSPKLRGELLLLAKCGAVALVLAALGWLVFAKEFFGSYNMIVGLSFWLLAVVVFFLPPLFVRRYRYRVTNYRIDFETGLIGKTIDSKEINRVHDVQFKQTIIDRILGVGTITLHSSDATTPTLDLRSLPEPRKLYDMLKRRVDEVKVKQRVLRVDNV